MNGVSHLKQERFDLLAGEVKSWENHVESPPEFVTTDGVNYYAGFSDSGGKVVAWNSQGKRLWVAGANGDMQAITYCQGRLSQVVTSHVFLQST